MRRTLGLIAVALGAALVVTGSTNAKGTENSVLIAKADKEAAPAVNPTDETGEAPPTVTVRTNEEIDVTPEEKQRAALAQQKATAEEQQIQSRLRGLQVLMQKEETALAQRLAQAAKIREQGLAKNDQKLLDQAEQYERQALDYYQKRCQQFEKASISVESTTVPAGVSQPPRVNRPTSPPNPTPPSRSTSRTRTRR